MKQNETLNPAPVQSVYLLPADDFSTCPKDQYMLIARQVELDVLAQPDAQQTIQIPANLRFCPSCKRIYLTPPELNRLYREQGIAAQQIDILGTPRYPRAPVFTTLHADPAAAAPAAEPKPRSAQSSGPSRKSRGALNIAFKYTYCDGGETDERYGFRGVCSDSLFAINAGASRSNWCSRQGDACRAYATQDDPEAMADESPCRDSSLFINWVFTPGQAHNGQPLRIGSDRSGYYVVATTVLPGEKENDRLIIAVCEIAGQIEDETATWLETVPEARLELTKGERVLYWDHYMNPNNTGLRLWGTGHRNLTNDQIASILQNAAEQIDDEERRELAHNMLERVETLAERRT